MPGQPIPQHQPRQLIAWVPVGGGGAHRGLGAGLGVLSGARSVLQGFGVERLDVHCLCLGCHNKMDWVAYKQYKFISYSSEGWAFKIRVPTWLNSGRSPLLVADCRFLAVSSRGGKGQGYSWVYFVRTLIPVLRVLSF